MTDYDYGYPYAAGYGYDDYYGDSGCYIVRQRVPLRRTAGAFGRCRCAAEVSTI